MKKELDRQLAATRLLKKANLSFTTTSSYLAKDEQEEEEEDYEDSLLESTLLEDLKTDPTVCAFLSNDDGKCLTNEQVYHLINDRSDLMKFPKSIEQQINKPNEQVCTSIDLSAYFFPIPPQSPHWILP